jgi:hypothetical protein
VSINRVNERIYVALFTLVAAYTLVWPLWRMFYPMQIWFTEGWNAYHQTAALHGVLYPPPDTLIVNNYPPLSFYLIGGLGEWFGNPIAVGRVLSIISVFGLGAVAGLIVRRLGGGAMAATLAGIWFIAVMAGPFNRYVGMNDPQLFAQLVMALALLWFLDRDARGASAIQPVLLMVVAGFIKHNIVVIPATVLLWLMLRDGRRAIPTVIAGVAAAVIGLLICVGVYGEAFLQNLFVERSYVLSRAVMGLGRLQWVLPAIILWAVWAVQARATKPARFTALFIGLGVLCYLVQWTGESVSDNAQFDLLFGTAVGIGVAFEGVGIKVAPGAFLTPARCRAIAVAVLLIRILATGRIEPGLILFDPQYRALFPAHAEVVRSEIARVAAIKGDVWCSAEVICWRAGKPFAADGFRIEQMIYTGRYTEADIDALLRQRGITKVKNGPRVKAAALDRNLFKKQAR